MQERKKTIVKTRTVRKKDGTIHKVKTVKKVSKHVDHKNDKKLQYVWPRPRLTFGSSPALGWRSRLGV